MKGMKLAGEKGYSVYERLWTRPALAVIAMESHPLKGSSNQILDTARARLSLRTVPNMDGEEAGRLLIRKLTRKPPYGVKVTAELTMTAPWWTTDPEGPAFEAARRALEAGYKKPVAMTGSGGSIGFVGPFAELLGGAPCLLISAMGRNDATSIHPRPLQPMRAACTRAAGGIAVDEGRQWSPSRRGCTKRSPPVLTLPSTL